MTLFFFFFKKKKSWKYIILDSYNKIIVEYINDLLDEKPTSKQYSLMSRIKEN